MYCRKCYANLEDLEGAYADGKCPNCGETFDPNQPATFLRRPFPDATKITSHLIQTTFIGILVAFIVAIFQMVRNSGH